MSILSDKEIAQRLDREGPFGLRIVPYSGSVRQEWTISYGLTSYGYDVRLGTKFKVFTNALCGIIDPKAFDTNAFEPVVGDECLIPPNSFALAESLEAFKIPRDVLALCLGKSTYARCFTGNTRVALANGTSVTFAEMVRNPDVERWGYGVRQADGKYVLTRLVAPRQVGTESVVRVTLDDGSTIDCTPDHEFLRHGGHYTQAADLRPGDGVVPLYRRVERGREAVWIPAVGGYLPTHWLADNWNVENGVYADAPGWHRHHVDHDKLNNYPTNIVRKEPQKHIAEHNTAYYGEGFDALGHGEKISSALASRMADPEWAEAFRRSQTAKVIAFHHDEQFAAAREKRRQALRDSWTEERRKAAADRMRARKRGNHSVVSVKPLRGKRPVYCCTSLDTGNFALQCGVIAKNCGIIVNVTPLEPEWHGKITIEISNTAPLPAKVYAGEGIMQLVFLKAEHQCAKSYKDKKGKYQGQKGITLPKVT